MTSRKNESLSILFIGNSFSYYHCLPKLVADFVRASSLKKVIAEGVFRGGATLKELWDDGHALKKLRNKKWDYVVLQERGRLGGIIKEDVVHVGKPKAFIAYATRFNSEIKKSGAKTILYCPPAFLGVGLISDAKKLHAAYATLARKLQITMIPSEIAFSLALKKRPHMNLYERDRHHPNPLGTYLLAALFYRKLFHKKIESLPLKSYVSRSSQLPRFPKKIKLSEADAQFLCSIADQIK